MFWTTSMNWWSRRFAAPAATAAAWPSGQQEGTCRFRQEAQDRCCRVAFALRRKSSNWSKSRAYFAPEGSYFLLRKDKSLYGEGRWTVRGNKICARFTWARVKRRRAVRSTNAGPGRGPAGRTGRCGADQKTGYDGGELKKLAKPTRSPRRCWR